MIDQKQASSVPLADPRVTPLLDLTQRLIGAYVELATSAAPHLPDGARSEFGEQARRMVSEATARFKEIAALPAETVGNRIAEYARRPGIDDGQRAILQAAVRIASGEEL